MMTLLRPTALARCRVFGVFAVEGPQGPIRIRSRRARALLGYLLLAPPGGASRERLSGLLWSDRGEEQARASLRQCLLELRKELLEAGLEPLEVRREHIALKPGGLATDLDEIQAAIRDQDGAALATALRAVGTEALLDDLAIGGVYDDWLSRTRAQLESDIERQVRALLQDAESRRAWEEVRTLAEAFLLRAPADETVAAAAIRADMALGVTSAAHRRFRALESTLAQEYGVKPGLRVSSALSGDPPPEPLVAAAAPDTLSPGPEPSMPIVVVGAFESPAGDERLLALAQSLRDGVISGLARFRDMAVVTDPHAETNLDGDSFAAPELVFLLTARLRAAERTHMSVRLSGLKSRNVVWSASFDIPEAEVLHALDDVVARVVGAVLPSIDLDLARPRHELDRSGIYIRYVNAHWLARNAETYEQAKAVATDLEALIAEQPRFALSYLPLAYLYNTDFNNTRAGSSDTALRERALELARTAMRLDRGHSHGYVVAAWSHLRLRRWDAARQFLDQALALNPYNPNRLIQIGAGFLYLDERDRARDILDRALLVNPTPQDEYFTALGLLEFVCGAHDRASTYFELAMYDDLWHSVWAAINADLAGQGGGPLAERARAQVAAVWPADQPMEDPALSEWILAHNPFRSEEVKARFMAGAMRMLGRA